MARGIPRPPPHAPGMRIGLFGGTFNPPHAGHALVCAIALRRLRLDALWLMVSPGNPLKSPQGLPPLGERMAAARAMIRDPRVKISGFEAELGARYSYQTVDYLRRACPGVHFVWIMGADNLAGFFRWRRWRDIARKMPNSGDRPAGIDPSRRARAAGCVVRAAAAAGISGANPAAARPAGPDRAAWAALAAVFDAITGEKTRFAR